jgi:uncharacterized membrane protein
VVAVRSGRLLAHLLTTAWSVRRAFPPRALEVIEQAIRDAEATHSGEIRFAVEHSLDLIKLLRGESAGERALAAFSELRVWDTEHNNGVLIYLLLADRDVEIVADRGIHARVGPDGWEAIARRMEAAFLLPRAGPAAERAAGPAGGALTLSGATAKLSPPRTPRTPRKP